MPCGGNTFHVKTKTDPTEPVASTPEIDRLITRDPTDPVAVLPVAKTLAPAATFV